MMHINDLPLTLLEWLQKLVRYDGFGSLRDTQTGLDFKTLALNGQALAREWAFGPGDRIALVAEPSVDFVQHLLACWQIGVLPLVMAATDWQIWSLEQRQRRLKELQIRAIWSAGRWLAGCVETQSAVGTVSMPDDPALVLFTSGSSGQPKGVVLSHAAILANLKAIAVSMNLSEPASVAIMLPLHHSFALVTQLLLTLYTGGEIHLLPTALMPGERVRYLQSHQIERLAGVPTHFRLLCSDPELKLPHLRHIKVAGAALDQGLAAQILALAPRAELWVGYGLTEAGPRVTAISHHDPLFFRGSVGKPIAGVQLRIEDSEVYIRSESNMLAYLDQPDLSAERFSEGWLCSGDCGSLEGEYLYLDGRKDDVFQSAGEKIAPLEIENMLQACVGVEAVAVYGEADPALGHRIAACIQGTASLRDLRQYVRLCLAPEKRPQVWYAVDNLPQTANGKLKRKELPTWPKTLYTKKF